MKMIVIDADYNFTKNNEVSLRLYGKVVDGDKNGKDIVLHVLGTEPYIYVGNTDINIFKLQQLIEQKFQNYIKRTEIVPRYLPLGYQIERSPMLRLVLYTPKIVPILRDELKQRIRGITDANLFEADILYTNRCMVDMGISGMDVIEFPDNKIPNYGLNCSLLYLCNKNEIKVLKDEVMIEY